MAAPKNDKLRNQILFQAAIMRDRWAPGDKSIAWQLYDMFRGILDSYITNKHASKWPADPERKRQAGYRLICYYLRPQKKCAGDTRRKYTAKELDHLSIMSPRERAEWAQRTSRSTRAVSAALARYLLDKDDVPEIDPNATAEALPPFVDFSNVKDLRRIGQTRNDVVAANKSLATPYSLALRAPNILYHMPTKRRYYMDAAEQEALLRNPKLFLRGRATHIKDHWVRGTLDPIADPEPESVASEVFRPQRRRSKLIRSIEELTLLLRATSFENAAPSLTDPLKTLYKELTTIIGGMS